MALSSIITTKSPVEQFGFRGPERKSFYDNNVKETFRGYYLATTGQEWINNTTEGWIPPGMMSDVSSCTHFLKQVHALKEVQYSGRL